MLSDWWGVLVRAGVVRPGTTKAACAALITATATMHVARGFFLQVVWGLARRAELCLLLSERRGRASPRSIASCATNLLDILMHRHRLDYELLRLVAACKEATRGHSSFSWACDKANVGGVGLHNSVLVLHDNRAMVLAPQAVFWAQLLGVGRLGRSAAGARPTERSVFLHFLVYTFFSGK